MLKAKHGWSYSSFNDLLRLLGSFLPKPNFVPKNTYKAKKIISPLSMHVQRIHACPNKCSTTAIMRSMRIVQIVAQVVIKQMQISFQMRWEMPSRRRGREAKRISLLLLIWTMTHV
jgi:hypothetical protein